MTRSITRYGLVVSAALWIGVLAPQARAAQVHVNINIGAPPPIIVHSAPTMLYLAEPAVYVAVGIPYDLFFVGGRYYYVRGSTWYWGPGYGGPWTTVVYRSLPPGLQKYKVARLREFRDYGYRTYRVDNRGKHFVADYGPDKGKAKGNGKGRGRGNR